MFKRGLSDKNLAALGKLTEPGAGENWWKEVLACKDLLLAVRGSSLNAYVNGQSVFKVDFEDADSVRPNPSIHYKYLIRPELDKHPYISFDGKSFSVEPADIVQTEYAAKLTLPQLIRTASRFSDREKSGVHKIARAEPKVIDLEIAFRHTKSQSESSVVRMDLALLLKVSEDEASVVFCEAKCANNKELWTEKVEKDEDTKLELSREISVVDQVAKYQKFIGADENRDRLVRAYTRVCKNLVALDTQGSVRPLDELVKRVADGMKLTIHRHVYLLVYDFDSDQRDGLLKKRLGKLEKRGLRIIAKGDPKAFSLANDVQARIKKHGP